MPVASINIPLMANLVAAVEGALSTLPAEQGGVRGKLGYVYLSTESLTPVDRVVTWAEDELVGLRRRLALARSIEASEPGIQSTVTIDEDDLPTTTPEEAVENAEQVAAALTEDPENIPDAIVELLQEGASDPYFAAALANALPPGELAEFLRNRESMGIGYRAAGMASDEEALAWAAQQRALQEALGETYGLATMGEGDLALPSEWHEDWSSAITSEDFDDRTNPSHLTLLMRHGVWSSDVIYNTYVDLEMRDWNGDVNHNTVSGPEYWLELVGSSSSYEGASIPNDYGGYDMAFDPMESLMLAMANNPDAAVEFFAMTGADVATIEVGGQEHQINMYLHDMLFNREWQGDDFDALVAAIEAAVVPRDGGSADSALVAADLQAVMDYSAEQQEIAEANEPPLWKQILHGVLDVIGFIPIVGEPADLINATWYAADGDYVNASLSAAGAIPLIGYAAVGGRWVRRTRLVDRAEFDELVAAGRLTTVDGTDLARMADGTDVAPSFQRFLDSVEIPEDAIRLGSGTTGGWTTALHRPLPNQTYVVDGRFVYRTDAQGRVIGASGHLDSLPGGARNKHQQGVAGRGDRLPDDQGGHIFGRWFGGPGEGINLLAMNRSVNGASQYGRLEAQWAELISEGHVVDVDFRPVYAGTSTRPVEFEVRWRIDGELQPLRIFDNP